MALGAGEIALGHPKRASIPIRIEIGGIELCRLVQIGQCRDECILAEPANITLWSEIED